MGLSNDTAWWSSKHHILIFKRTNLGDFNIKYVPFVDQKHQSLQISLAPQRACWGLVDPSGQRSALSMVNRWLVMTHGDDWLKPDPYKTKASKYPALLLQRGQSYQWNLSHFVSRHETRIAKTWQTSSQNSYFAPQSRQGHHWQDPTSYNPARMFISVMFLYNCFDSTKNWTTYSLTVYLIS